MTPTQKLEQFLKENNFKVEFVLSHANPNIQQSMMIMAEALGVKIAVSIADLTPAAAPVAKVPEKKTK